MIKKYQVASSNHYIIGIDEVGRGSLAGPVTVAAVAATVNSKFHPPAGGQNSKLKLRDSKKLSPNQRECWFNYIKGRPRLFYSIASTYPKLIERLNISQAANLAAARALKKLVVSHPGLAIRAKVLLDGGLYLKNLKPYSRTVIKGDEKYNCIKLASIAAKVRRDYLMRRNHKKYPRYGFDKHKGYGTKKHLRAIKKYGPCRIHRQAFLKNVI